MVNILYTQGNTSTKTVAESEGYDLIREHPNDNLAFWVNLKISDGGTLDLSDELGPKAAWIDTSSFSTVLTTGSGDDWIKGGTGADTFYGGDGEDDIYGNWDFRNCGAPNVLYGGNGNDTLSNGGADSIFYGGEGNDRFGNSDANTQMYGENGDDLFRFTGVPSHTVVDGGSGIDTLETGFLERITYTNIEVLSVLIDTEGTVQQFEGFDSIKADDFFGDLSLRLTNGGTADLADELGDRDAEIRASTAGNTIISGAGNDTLVSQGASDVLVGGRGNDSLRAYSGHNVMNGGEGTDTAYFQGYYADYVVDGKSGVTSNLHLNVQSKLIDIEFVQFSDGLYDAAAGAFLEDPDVNSQPARIRLSSLTVSEDTPVKTSVGLLSAFDAEGDTLSYKLVDSADGHFRLFGNKVMTAAPFDYETDASHFITVAVSDGTDTAQQRIRIDVRDVIEDGQNTAPENLRLSRERVDENMPVGSSVGFLQATDAQHQTITWKLLDDADTFKLVGSKLVTTAAIDYEATPHLSITVEATDSLGAASTATLVLNVHNMPEADFLV
ncbi:calcium-binding protein [Rhizobium leguminosarum]|uniref:Ig-like domain-containing protein n=1 Tax=Rhizobium leguminosarum TaxID=384 RepID=UPI001C970524|nr:calcium-binding protein [Rhizobium leguminosarum]MBY5551302.1 calcium-binding protein [Rhizobium leguminosarum]